MKMTKILAMAAVAGATALTAGAADPGGYPGFVKAVFTGSACDTTSDVFAKATSWVYYPEEMYATSLAEKTTVAWGAYMWMEGGVQYNFKGCYDDFVLLTIGSTGVLTKGNECQERTGSYTPSSSAWYKIVLRVANNGGVGACQNSSQYGILWKKSTETTWRKFMAGSDGLFKTGTAAENLKKKSVKPLVEVISSEMRKNDPTVMDVKYYVVSASDKVDVRVLGFKDGTRSFANVIRAETFESGSAVGDNIAANTTNSFAWKVSSDWKVDLANVAIEVLAKNAGEGIVPLEWVTIPANGNNVEMTVSKNELSSDQVFSALLWLYADKDETMTLEDGVLNDSYGNLASGDLIVKYSYTWSTDYKDFDCRLNAARHIYAKMGYLYLNDYNLWLSYARSARREAMTAEYGYAVKCEIPKVEKGTGLYMVVSLDSLPCVVTYFDAEPVGGWGNEYKTKKLVLRRINSGSRIYYAGIFQVTEAQWAYVMGDGDESSKVPKSSLTYVAIRGNPDSYNWSKTTNVDRNSFVGQIRLMTGIDTFDLPKEDEWEYSARAGVTTKWLCGDDETNLGDYAWYASNSGSGFHEVGLKTPNKFGLYDVLGNIWEWCLSETWSAPLRGGSCIKVPSDCALDSSLSGYPSGCYPDFGFRLFCR